MKQELHSVADSSVEKTKSCPLLDEAAYSVGDTQITCRLYLSEGGTEEGEACCLALTTGESESLSIHFDSLETGRKILSLLTQNEVSLYHVADILDDMEISAQISSSAI